MGLRVFFFCIYSQLPLYRHPLYRQIHLPPGKTPCTDRAYLIIQSTSVIPPSVIPPNSPTAWQKPLHRSDGSTVNVFTVNFRYTANSLYRQVLAVTDGGGITGVDYFTFRYTANSLYRQVLAVPDAGGITEVDCMLVLQVTIIQRLVS